MALIFEKRDHINTIPKDPVTGISFKFRDSFKNGNPDEKKWEFVKKRTVYHLVSGNKAAYPVRFFCLRKLFAIRTVEKTFDLRNQE